LHARLTSRRRSSHAEEYNASVIDRSLNTFSVALLGVTATLFLCIFSATPIVCGLGPNISLPWATTATLITESNIDLMIYIKADRALFIGSNFIPRATLQSELQKIATRTPRRHVFINADRTVSYALVEDVIRSLRGAGFTRVSLVTFRGTRLEAWQRGAA
jgi:biopolymer transport protein ExbD